MKTTRTPCSSGIRSSPLLSRGIAFGEILLILTATALLAAIVLTGLRRTQNRLVREECLKNIQYLSSGFQLWLHDYEDRFPWSIRPGEGGSQGEPAAYAHWRTLSNYLGTARFLMCPGLAKYRAPVDRMDQVTRDLNVAYALGLDGRVVQPFANNASMRGSAAGSILVTDMDLTSEDGKPTFSTCGRAGGIQALTFPVGKSMGARWSATNHHPFGQLGIVDGSALSVNNLGLRKQLSLTADTGTGESFHLLPPDLDKMSGKRSSP